MRVLLPTTTSRAFGGVLMHGGLERVWRDCKHTLRCFPGKALDDSWPGSIYLYHGSQEWAGPWLPRVIYSALQMPDGLDQRNHATITLDYEIIIIHVPTLVVPPHANIKSSFVRSVLVDHEYCDIGAVAAARG